MMSVIFSFWDQVVYLKEDIELIDKVNANSFMQKKKKQKSKFFHLKYMINNVFSDVWNRLSKLIITSRW